MARYARISTISMNGGSGATVEEKMKSAVSRALELIDRAATDRPDLIVLPETFTGLGCGTKDWFLTAETVPGDTSERLAEKAREYGCHIVCPILRKDRERLYNSAVLLDRKGEIAGIFNKMFPTIGEVEGGVTPGAEATVIETDFGRVGFAICFDLNFAPVAEGLAANGAELVCFPSMYRGGLQARNWAFTYRFFLATATPGEGSVIVDPIGQILEQSSAYERVISRRINLDYGSFHIDYNLNFSDKMKAKYGESIEFDILSPEGQFILYSHHPEVTVKDLTAEFNLELTADYFARATHIRNGALAEKDSVHG